MPYLEKLFNLREKVVVVTGATGQIGTVICRAFQELGALVVGLDVNIKDHRTDGIHYHKLDITDSIENREVFNSIVERHGNLDILVNNAGVSAFEPFEKRSEESFDWVMNVNLKGTFLCIQNYVHVFDKFRLKTGSIVNIGSVFGSISPDYRNYTDCNRRNSEVYGATKAGIIQMTRYFAVHLAERNIRVNAVSPGGIFNPVSPQGDDFLKNYAFRCPMKRMGNDGELVGAIVYLASGAASYTTGHNLIVDGGMTCW